MAGGASAANSTNGVRIVVAGDRGTGKSSLIITAAAEAFPANVPPVLPPTRLPEDMFPDRVPVTVIDTSSRYSPFYFNKRHILYGESSNFYGIDVRLKVITCYRIIRCNETCFRR